VVPVHLNELSPPALRATFPGFVYQLGNLIASYNAPLQTMIAESHGTASSQPDFAFALMLVCGIVAAHCSSWRWSGRSGAMCALMRNEVHLAPVFVDCAVRFALPPSSHRSRRHRRRRSYKP